MKPEMPVEMKVAERLTAMPHENEKNVDNVMVLGSKALSQAVVAQPLERLAPPAKRQRVTVADIIGPEETRKVIEEKRDAQRFARTVSSQRGRRRGR